jgi:hypothetical protein
MLKYATVALCAIAFVACHQSETTTSTGVKPGANQPSDVRNAKISEVIPPPRYVDHATLGTDLGADGIVAKESDTFTAGEPVYLSMFFLQSPPGLQAGAVWTTADKKPVHTERRSMNGAKVATFAVTGLKPGRYKVQGYWGGNIAAEREFEVKGAGAAKRKK